LSENFFKNTSLGLKTSILGVHIGKIKIVRTHNLLPRKFVASFFFAKLQLAVWPPIIFTHDATLFFVTGI